MTTALKVGALAKRTGLTVRTLHHYDEIGLLEPSGRTPSGHRLYGEQDVERLQRIASLRHLGLPLDEIRDCLANPDYSLDRVLEMQLERIDEQISRQQRLRKLIEHLRDRIRTDGGATVDELTRTIEVTMSYEKYYTPEQLEQLRRRLEEVGEERIREVRQEWTDLFTDYRRAMEDGLDPASEEVQALAATSAALIEEFTGGDPGILESLTDLYRGEGAQNVTESHGMGTTPDLWAYMGRAREAAQGGG